MEQSALQRAVSCAQHKSLTLLVGFWVVRAMAKREEALWLQLDLLLH
jgi:hypothetical protein